MRVVILWLLILCSLNAYSEAVSASPDNQAGKATYEQFCSVCHRDGLAGAPKFEDEHDWTPRLSNKTMDDLLRSVTQGLNVMPPKGTCSDCTDEALKAAIQYMVPKS